jgi:hypothetical protein
MVIYGHLKVKKGENEAVECSYFGDSPYGAEEIHEKSQLDVQSLKIH